MADRGSQAYGRPSAPVGRAPAGVQCLRGAPQGGDAASCRPDDRYVYLSDVLPTAWQAVAYADVPPGGSVTVLGLGPIGDMATTVARHLGAELAIGVDLVPEGLARSAGRGVQVFDVSRYGKDLPDAIRALTHGRGTYAVIDAVGMEAHGAPLAKTAQWATGLLPGMVARTLMEHTGVDRLAALYTAIDVVRRGGTISLSGVYGGAADPMPLLTLFDKQIQLRMGQANVKRWVPDLLPLLTDENVLGVDDFATHRLPLADGPKAYAMFQGKEDGMVKTLLKP